MFKTRSPLPGSPPGTLDSTTRAVPADKPVIRVVEYEKGDLVEREVASIDELPACDAEDRVHWIEINGSGDPDVLRALGEKYHLHPLALEDVMHTPQRPKMEAYDDYLFIVAQMTYIDAEQRICGEQVSMFLRKNLLITIQEESDFDVFNPVRDRIRGGRGFIRTLGPDYLAYALLDAIIDHCFPLLETIGDALETLEDDVLEKPEPRLIARIHEFRRTLLQIRRFVWPERDVVNALLHDDSGLVSKQTKVFLRDCYDHTVQIMELIESYREVSSGLMDLYMSSVSMRTNDIMRVLTVISAIFIPLTFIAGVYGMNFQQEVNGVKMPLNMPELSMPHGYIVCLALMAVVAAGLVIFFKRKHWL